MFNNKKISELSGDVTGLSSDVKALNRNMIALAVALENLAKIVVTTHPLEDAKLGTGAVRFPYSAAETKRPIFSPGKSKPRRKRGVGTKFQGGGSLMTNTETKECRRMVWAITYKMPGESKMKMAREIGIPYNSLLRALESGRVSRAVYKIIKLRYDIEYARDMINGTHK